ncbi:MAG: PH domain-containing protein [Acidimicrobiales bacterium]
MAPIKLSTAATRVTLAVLPFLMAAGFMSLGCSGAAPAALFLLIAGRLAMVSVNVSSAGVIVRNPLRTVSLDLDEVAGFSETHSPFHGGPVLSVLTHSGRPVPVVAFPLTNLGRVALRRRGAIADLNEWLLETRQRG